MRFDRVITLCDKVREICPEFPGAAAPAHWSIPDPAADENDEATYPAFRHVADELESRIDFLIAELAVRPTERMSHVR
jgi:protein-tyrosine-phosphatase